jgi:excisionase family DNA binding protein
LGVHEQTVRNLIARGDLGSVMVGRLRKVTSDQVDDYIDRHSIAPAS